MFRSVIVLGFVVGGIAYADEPCRPATRTVHSNFKADSTVADLAAWIHDVTCKPIVFDSGLAIHATKVSVIGATELTPRQAFQLFSDAMDAVGLVVIQKPDTIIVKPGPGTPRKCPDVVAAAVAADADADVQSLLDRGLRRIDDTHFALDAEIIDKLLANPMVFAKGVRVVPTVKDGKPAGFKLYALRPGSLFARLGMVNGDTLAAINGMSLTSADKALEIYTRLRDAKTMTLDIDRRGTPITVTLTIK
jgi:general secretion pathway protein C